MAAITLGPATSVPEGTGKQFMLDGHPIAVFQVNGAFYALDDTCSHADASLSEGELDEDERGVECPLHGSIFAFETGKPLTLPAYEPVSTYPVSVEGGMLIVEYSG